MNDWIADYPLGTVVSGTNTAGQTVNDPQMGREYTFPVSSAVSGALGLTDRDTGVRCRARLVRNSTGSAVLPGDVVVVDTGSAAGLGDADADGTAGARYAYVADPDLPAAGCPDGDLFYVITKGPTTVKVIASEDTAEGDKCIAGAGGLADPTGTWGTNDHQVMGTFLGATTYAAGQQCPVDLHPAWG